MLAFGHFVLPLAAIVALGLLFVGIKLFFLTPGDRGGIDVAPVPPVAAQQDQEVPPTDTVAGSETVDHGTTLVAGGDPVSTADTQTPNTTPGGASEAVLAGPLGGSSPSSGTNAQTTRPVDGTVVTPRPTDSTTPPPANRPRVSANVRWGVQIGAFQKEEGAKTLADEVRKAGYTASISTAKNSSGTTFHRVRVAAGNSRDDAAKLSVELEKKGYPVLVVSN